LGRDVAALVVGGLLAVAAILAVSSALQGPAFVDQVTIRNSTPSVVDVEVTTGDRDGWLPLGPVSPGEQHDFNAVVDQGDRWVVHVSSARADGGEFVLSRTELERHGWVVTIPDEVSARLIASAATRLTPRQ
jgi:ribosomal protein S1